MTETRPVSFAAYVQIARKPKPVAYWTPVAPLHRVFSYPLSYAYTRLGLTPLLVSILGVALAVAGTGLILWAPHGPVFLAGIALLNLGVVHDACDGEVARYRIHRGLQSPRTYRVGMFADLWAFTMVVQSMLPALLGWYAHRQGAHWGIAVAGTMVQGVVLASYIVGFARSAYWPGTGTEVVEESFSFVPHERGLLALARRVYFNIFETAMFTTHASVVLIAWSLVGRVPWWAYTYVAFVLLGLLCAFTVATLLAFRGFDRQEVKPRGD